MKKSILAALALSCASLLVTTASFANEGDVQACDGKADGDACTRSDGSAGTCEPDDSDPAHLHCEDESSSSSSGSGSCSITSPGAASAPVSYAAALALGLAAVLGRARRPAAAPARRRR